MKRFLVTSLLVLTALPSAALALPNGSDFCKKQIDSYKAKIRKNPEDDEAWNQFRVCVNELKRWNDGSAVALDVLDKHPDTWQAHLMLGISQLHGKEYEKAVTAFERATQLKSDAPAPYYYLGMAYLFSGRTKEASEVAAKAVTLEPANSSYHSQLAYALLLEDDRERCEAEAKKAIELDPNNVSAYKVLGNLYKKEGKQEAADQAFEEAIHANGRLSGNPLSTAKGSAGVAAVAALPGMGAAVAASKAAAAPVPVAASSSSAEDQPENRTPGVTIAFCRDQWQSMKDAILRRDIEKGLSYFSDYAGTRDQYRQAFEHLGQDRVRQMFAELGELYDCTVVFAATTCKASVTRNTEGNVSSSEVTVRFERNSDGIWRIRSF